jgi:deoxyribodipyrimidine photo-lyase
MNIYWFQNDLRTFDMPILSKALERGTVIGIYIFDPSFFKLNTFGIVKKDQFYLNHVYDALVELKFELEKLNIPLYIFKSTIAEAIHTLKQHVVIDAIYAEYLLGYEEEKSYHFIQKLGISLIQQNIHSLYTVEDIPYNIKHLPDIFTVFRKKIEEKPYIAKKDNHLNPQRPTQDIDIPFLSKETLGIHPIYTYMSSGMNQALKHIHNYFEKGHASTYKLTRNDMYVFESSTKFSPHLAIGTLSPEMIMRHLLKYELEVEKNESTYWIYFELLWRDFFYFTHLKFKHQVFLKDGLYGSKKSIHNEVWIQAWMKGETGFPLIDANMRFLNQTGYMSNRGRQNVASFFVLVLNQDWRIGASYFESKLIDYDVSSNTLNWLYLSGLGNDPRENRMFNMIKQGEQYDPNRTFVKKMLPELEDVPNHLIYRVHTFTDKERETYHLTYQKPIMHVKGYV